MNCDKSIFAPLLSKIIYGFFDCFRDRTHCYDYVLGIFRSVVLERTILATSEFADLAHVASDHVRNFLICGVPGFCDLEVNVTILCGATSDRGIRIQCLLAESLQGFFADHAFQGFFVKSLYLLYFVRCAESVEEMQEWDAGLDCREVSHCSKILSFLDRAGSEQGETCLTASHHVLVVSEDRKGVGCKRTS